MVNSENYFKKSKFKKYKISEFQNVYLSGHVSAQRDMFLSYLITFYYMQVMPAFIVLS